MYPVCHTPWQWILDSNSFTFLTWLAATAVNEQEEPLHLGKCFSSPPRWTSALLFIHSFVIYMASYIKCLWGLTHCETITHWSAVGQDHQISTNQKNPHMGRDPSYIAGGNVNWYSHYGKQYGGSLKTENRVTTWSSNPTPGHISREKYDPKAYMHPKVHCSTVYNSQDMKAT